MDTKSKSRRKLFVVTWLAFEWLLVAVMGGMDYDSLREAIDVILALMVASAAGAWVFPLVKSFGTGEERIFQMPTELVVCVAVFDAAYAANSDFPYYIYTSAWEGLSGALLLEGFLIFAFGYWASGSLRQLYVMGAGAYLREHSLLVRYGRRLPALCRKIYHSLEQIDFREKGNKTILKIVAVNFVILSVVTTLWWYYGIFALLLYSVILFLLLRKYFKDLKIKYARVLEATNQMAGGNLNVEMNDDWGIFEPFRQEFAKIQSGYQEAVAKEVKSQNMKTELITNVSHDLKTPLTAIITYVSLLKEETAKEETDQDKQKEYIDVLERKSLRLKVLIEDLFEISKASSRNVTLNIVNLDVVNLFKQVKLELEDRFQEAGLDFRCTWPEEKLICPLDSQKTYRIFENLLVNIAKYAMKGTRVYVKIRQEENEAVIELLNISAEEITVDGEALTERFVRGDASRNTEGSGLGLAIARSFTELQKGTFRLTVEGDLFKVEVRFLVWMKENPAA